MPEPVQGLTAGWDRVKKWTLSFMCPAPQSVQKALVKFGLNKTFTFCRPVLAELNVPILKESKIVLKITVHARKSAAVWPLSSKVLKKLLLL